MTIYLIGSMGVGKSSLGRMIAENLKIPFLDTDDEVVSREGLSINTIFKTRGESYFRDLETEILTQIDSTKSQIIATGGGLPMYNNNMDYMLTSGVVVYLQMNVEKIIMQVYRDRYKRPTVKSLSIEDLEHKLKTMLRLRIPVYERAHLVFERKIDRKQESLELSTYLRMFI